MKRKEGREHNIREDGGLLSQKTLVKEYVSREAEKCGDQPQFVRI